MKVIYFERIAKSTIHIHASLYIKGVYIPDKNIVLYKERQGTFGGQTYSFTERKEFLDEIRLLSKGITPNMGGVTYLKIKEFEYSETKLKELIQNTKLERTLRDKVITGIGTLLEQAK